MQKLIATNQDLMMRLFCVRLNSCSRLTPSWYPAGYPADDRCSESPSIYWSVPFGSHLIAPVKESRKNIRRLFCEQLFNLKTNEMDNYHLAKEDEQWKLRREGAERASKVFDGTKVEAIRQSAEFLKDRGASLKVHKENGQFQEERTYPRSADPRESKG